MAEQKKLPIKVVPPLRDDFVIPESGGGSSKFFVENIEELQGFLLDQLSTVKTHFAPSFALRPKVPGVMRVALRREAIAKSHRPTRLFSQDSCPIIGMESLGDLLISVTPTGLEKVINDVATLSAQLLKANITTIERITYFSPHFDSDLCGKNVKIKLFQHHNSTFDYEIEKEFFEILHGCSLQKTEKMRYGPGLSIYKVHSPSASFVEQLSVFAGIQSVSNFPIYYPVRTSSLPVGKVNAKNFPLPEENVSYPVVGVIDTGTQKDIPILEPWIVDRENYIPEGYANHNHGTFVSGLLAHSKAFNHGDPRFPGCAAKIVDVAAIPTSGISEDELLSILEEVLPKHPEVKHWNLSLGTNTPISNSIFSDFGVSLDRLQQEYGVIFYLAAGNHTTKLLPQFQRKGAQDSERICAPADSVRSVVVGAMAHTHNKASLSRTDEVSPFSRKGPGPLYLPKPDISHYGGNCNNQGYCTQSGVLSIASKGEIVEDVGTSFATPLVSVLSSNIAHSVMDASPNLTKALLIHSAAMNSGASTPSLLHNRGFGVPPDLDSILSCPPWACTMIFEFPLRRRTEYRKIEFPIAPSLHIAGNKVRANFLMTLVYDPELDASYGSEYCRTNVEVSLGTVKRDKAGKYHHAKQVPEDPKLRGSAYEVDLIESGFKWSPVKVYRREINRGIDADQWQLILRVLERSGHACSSPQSLALIITISDPDKYLPVYDETVVLMNQLGWGAYDLEVQSRLRI